MTPERPRCAAIIGAGTLEGKELFERLKALGLEQEEILCFGATLGSWEMALLPNDEEAEVFLPLEVGLLAPADYIFVLTRDVETRSAIKKWAGKKGCLLDMASPPAGPARWVDPFHPRRKPPPSGFHASVPDPEALYLAKVVRALPAAGLERVDCHIFLPASVAGELGVKELFQQSVSVLDFKAIPTEVFGRQVAFNLVPLPEHEAALGFARQVTALSGRDVEVTSVYLKAPVFHSMAVSAVFTVGKAASALESLRRFVNAQDLYRLAEDEEWPTPLDVAGDERPLLGLRTLSPRHLWAWLLFDNVKAGKALFASRLFEALRDLP